MRRTINERSQEEGKIRPLEAGKKKYQMGTTDVALTQSTSLSVLFQEESP